MPKPSGFAHGTYSYEIESAIKSIIAVKNPIVVVGTAPINMTGDLTNINKIQLINNVTDAATYFGGATNIKGFSISESLYVGLQLFGVSPIVCINVLDPTIHKTYDTKEELVVLEKRVTLSQVGILPESLVVKNNTNSTPITGFTSSFKTDGTLVITLPDNTVTKIDVEYDYLDTSLVTDDDIIGSIDPETLERKGLECLDNLFGAWSMIPSYVITPGYNSNIIRAILDTKASVINGKWSSMSIVDLPENTIYGEAVQFKKQNNWIDSDQIVCFGLAKFGDDYFHQSIFAACLSSNVDNSGDNGGVPYESPSNKNIIATGIAYKAADGKYIDLNLSEEEANILNENGICTIISRPNGIVFWGNRTSAFQPGGSSDPKDIWIPIKRMFKYIANNIMLSRDIDVDKPMTYSRVSNIQTNINVWLDSLTAQEKLLGARTEFNQVDNPINDLLAGNFTWHIYLGGVLPGEALIFGLEYDADYLYGYFEGGAAA